MNTTHNNNFMSACLLAVCVAVMTFAGTDVRAAEGEPVGKVITTKGTVSAQQADGAVRELKRRSPVFQGDTVVTEVGATLQVRMMDGALISIKENSEFRLDEYNYNGVQDGSESVALTLVKGGMRTVTGAIGRTNKDTYKVTTRVATIGLRGTHYGLQDCQGNCSQDDGKPVDDGVYGGVATGRVTATNKGGTGSFGQDQYFHIASPDVRPRRLLTPPGFIFNKDDGDDEEEGEDKNEGKQEEKKAEDKKSDDGAGTTLAGPTTNDDSSSTTTQTTTPEFSSSEQTNNDEGTPTVVTETTTGVKAPANAFLAMAGFNQFGGQTEQVVINEGGLEEDRIEVRLPGDSASDFITLDTVGGASGVPVAFQYTDLETVGDFEECNPCSFDRGTASLVRSGSSSLGVKWGAWTGNYNFAYSSEPLAARSDSILFIYTDARTDAASLDNMSSRGLVDFRFSDGPGILDEQGHFADLDASSSMSMDFANQLMSGLNLGVTFTDTTGRGYTLSQSGTSVPFASLANFGISGSCSGGDCLEGEMVSGSAAIDFVGSGAEGSILNLLAAHGGGKGIVGSALFEAVPDTSVPAPDGSAVASAGFFQASTGGAHQTDNSLLLIPGQDPGDFIRLDTVDGVDNVVTATQFTDVQNTEDCNPCTFDRAAATLITDTSQTNSDTSVGVNWGSWQGAYQLSDGVNVPADQSERRQFMYSDAVTNLDNQALMDSFLGRGTAVKFFHVAGPSALDESGGLVTVQNTSFVELDFVNQELSDLHFDVDNGFRFYAVDLDISQGPYALGFNGLPRVPLMGNCSGNGSPCEGGVSLTGNGGGILVGAGGEGLIGDFGLINDAGTIGLTGVGLFKDPAGASTSTLAPIGSVVSLDSFSQVRATDPFREDTGQLALPVGSMTDDFIAIDTVDGHANIPVVGRYTEPMPVDANDCQPCIFDRGTATLSDVGNNSSFGATWGRWTGANFGWNIFETGEPNLVQSDSLLFMYSDRLTDGTAVSSQGSRGIVTFSFLDGPLAMTEDGQFTSIDPASFFAVDFVNEELTALRIGASFADRVYSLSKADGTPVSFLTAMDEFSIAGTCEGAGCGELESVSGSSTLSFLGNNAGAGLLDFGASNDTSERGIVGVGLFTEEHGTTTQAPGSPDVTGASLISAASFEEYPGDPFPIAEGGQLKLNGSGDAGDFITLATIGMVGNVPVGLRVTDNDPMFPAECKPCTFTPGTSVWEDVGGDTIGVNWGRWTGNWTFTDTAGNAISQSDSIALMYSDTLTDPMAMPVDQGILRFNFAGGPQVMDEQGRFGVIDSASFFDLDTDFQELADLRLLVSITDGNSFDIGLNTEGPVTLNYIDDFFPLVGNCTGCGPMGGTVFGEGDISFIGGTGEGGLLSFGVQNSLGEGVAGTGLFKNQGPVPVQAPDGSAAVVTLFDQFSGEPALIPDGGVVEIPGAGEFDEIVLQNVDGNPNIVTSFVTTDDVGPDCQPCTFDSGTATLNEAGNFIVADAEVSWGRWNGAYSVDDNGVSPVAQSADMLFMFADIATDPQVIAGQTGRGTVVFNYVDGPSAVDESGALVTISNASTVTLDFVAQEMVDVNLSMAGNGRNYSASLAVDAVVPFGEAGQLTGNCSGADCGIGAGTDMTGLIDGTLVGAGGEGVIGAFGLTEANPAPMNTTPLGVTGVGLFTENPAVVPP